MKQHSILRNYSIRSIIILVMVSNIDATAQLEPLSTQYMNSQIIINPGYTGIRNSFAVSMATRQQWLGIKGAPVNHTFSINSPLNKSMVSLGGLLNVYKAGPVQTNRLSLYYAYLIRLSHNIFISLGINGQIDNYNFSTADINIIDKSDPNFTFDIQNKFNPNFGAGLFLYSPKFFFGFSVPHILETKYKTSDDNRIESQIIRHYYISSGFGVTIGDDLLFKPSFMARFIENGMHSIDINTHLLYKNIFWVGASYRISNTVAGMAGIIINKSLSISYSYDMSVQNEPYIYNGSHEIILSFDSFKWIKRNKDRRFLRKKSGKDEEEQSIRSIRYF